MAPSSPVILAYRGQGHPRQYILAVWIPFIRHRPIVGSRFSDRAHYNEFVENGSKSWALMRRWLVLEVKNTQNRTVQRPKEKGPLAREWELPTPLASQGPLSFSWASLLLCEISIVIYPTLPFIFFLHLLVIHAHTRMHIPSATFFGTL